MSLVRRPGSGTARLLAILALSPGLPGLWGVLEGLALDPAFPKV